LHMSAAHTIPIEVTLRRTSDGTTKTLVNQTAPGSLSDDDLLAWWTRGNGECDCNRVVWFGDAEPLDDVPCGSSRYRLVKLSWRGRDVFDEERDGPEPEM